MEYQKIFDMYSEHDLNLCLNEVFGGDGYLKPLRDLCYTKEIDEDSHLGRTIFGLLLPFDQIPLHINTNSNYLLPVLKMRLDGRIKERTLT